MDIEIGPFSSGDEAEIIEISVRAWAPVFEELEPAVPNYVFKAFYPVLRPTVDWDIPQADGIRRWGA